MIWHDEEGVPISPVKYTCHTNIIILELGPRQQKSILIHISRGSILDIQAQITILRRLLWVELHIMAGPILSPKDR